MSFVPFFIPVGGSGRPPPALLPYLAGLGLFIGLVNYAANPSFTLNIQKSGTSAIITCNESGNHRIRQITQHNVDCLRKKGYQILSSQHLSKDDLTIAQLLADCKECNTYTNIDYEYMILHNIKVCDANKRLKWSAC